MTSKEAIAQDRRIIREILEGYPFSSAMLVLSGALKEMGAKRGDGPTHDIHLVTTFLERIAR